MAKTIEMNTTLKQLRLGSNDLGDEAASLIVRVLILNEMMNSLASERNNVTHAGANEI
jgi:hypothetical protein